MNRLGAIFCILIGAALTPRSASAHLEIPITSPLDGTIPYLVVIDDGSPTASARTPGLYASDRSGKWRNVLRGKLLRAFSTNGVLAQFDLGSKTGRYDALTVVDGKLYLFNLHSTLDSPETLIEIGGDQHPVIDVSSKNRVKLPLVHSLEDLKIFKAPEYQGTQTLLISLKHASPFGTGLTFSVTLKLPKTNDPNIDLTARPWMLDNDFLTPVQMQNLLSYGDDGVPRFVSPMILEQHQTNSVSNRPEPEPLVQWRADLKRNLERIAHESPLSTQIDHLPAVRLDNGAIELRQKPTGQLQGPPFYLYQVFDPLQNSEIITSGLKDQTGREFQMHGSIDRVSMPSGITSYSVFNHRQAFGDIVVSIDGGRLYLFSYDARSVLHSLFLEQYPGGAPAEVSYQMLPSAVRSETYLLLSKKGSGRQSTELFALKTLPEGGYVIRQKTNLMRRYLPSWEVLARTKNQKDDKGVIRYYFDEGTQVTETQEEYAQLYQKSQPLLDLQATSEGQRSEVFLEALKVVPLLKTPFLNHVTYGSLEGFNKFSGLYTEAVTATTPPTQDGGQLLEIPFNDQTKAILADLSFKISGPSKSPVKLRANVIAMDPAFKSGENGFSLKIIFTAVDANVRPIAENLPLFVANAHIKRPFSQLKNITLLKGEGMDETEVGLVYSFENATGEGNTAYSSFKVSMSSKDRFKVTGGVHGVISNTEAYDGTRLTEMIYRGPRGQIFISVTPNLPVGALDFKAVELAEGRIIEPNKNSGPSHLIGYRRGGKRAGTDGADESGGGDDESEDGFSSYSSHRHASWWMAGTYEVRRQLSKTQTNIAADIFDEKFKSQFPDVAGVLDQLSDRALSHKRKVLLVSERDKSALMESIIRAFRRESKYTASLSGNDFDAYVVDPDKSNQREVFANLHELKRSQKHKLVFANASDLLKIDVPQPTEGEDATYVVKDEHSPEEERKLPHILTLLDREGDIKSLKDANEPLKNTHSSLAIVATLAEWAKLKDQLDQLQQGEILNSFEIDNQFVISDWRVEAPTSAAATVEVKGYKDVPVTAADENVIPNVLPIARELANPKNPRKIKVLLAPESLLPRVRKTLMMRWSSEQGSEDHDVFSTFNDSLMLHEIISSKKVGGKAVGFNQNTYRSTLDSSRDHTHRRSVILGELDALQKIGRPQGPNGEHTFVLKDPADNSDAGAQAPHLLYLLANGGKVAPLQTDANGTPQAPPYSVLLIGTPTKWEELMRETQFENRFGLHKMFEVEEIVAPDRQTKVALIERVMASPQIRALQYSFQVTPDTPPSRDDAVRHRVMDLLVSRTDNLATQFHQEPTGAFLKVLSEFERAVVEDQQLRSSKVLNRRFVENLLSKVFSIPLNLNNLAENDPLKILSKENEAALGLQRAGYEGPMDLKLDIIRTIMSQTHNDRTRNLPSSVVLYGDSSTGKTFFFTTLIKMLGLRTYDFRSGANNDDAQAIVLHMGKVTGSKTDDSPDLMTADDVIKHLNNFLARPNGFRGFVLIDDAHKAPAEELKKIVSFIQAMFEAPGGFLNVKDAKGGTREVPMKNVSLFLTVNPTPDQEKIKRFAPKGTLEELIVAALSSTDSNGLQVEPSFLKRWGLLVNLSKFPQSAKAPKLQENLRADARNAFNSAGALTLVSPLVVNLVADKFPDANAREFLPEASQRILELPMRAGSNTTPVHIIIPQGKNRKGATDTSIIPQGRAMEGIPRLAGEIAQYVAKTAAAVPIDNRFDGKLSLLELMLDSFRVSVMETLAQTSISDPQIWQNPGLGESLLSPFLHALTGNLALKPYLPLGLLNLDPSQFGIRAGLEKKEFFTEVSTHSVRATQFYPLKFFDEVANVQQLDSLMTRRPSQIESRNRSALLTDYSNRLTPLLEKYLNILARTEEVARTDGPKQWLNHLDRRNPEPELQQLGAEMWGVFKEYLATAGSNDVTENNSDNFAALRAYDVGRLFMMAMDRAMTKLEWGPLAEFFANALTLASKDIDLGQLPGIQHYFFESKASLLRPATHDIVDQIASGSSHYKRWKADGIAAKRRDDFARSCFRLFETNYVNKSYLDNQGGAQ